MSNWLITLQEEDRVRESQLGCHMYRQHVWNVYSSFNGYLPTQKEISDFRKSSESEHQIPRIIFMQKLSE
jgi:hypothetical protein